MTPAVREAIGAVIGVCHREADRLREAAWADRWEMSGRNGAYAVILPPAAAGLMLRAERLDELAEAFRVELAEAETEAEATR